MATVSGTGKWLGKGVHKHTWAALANGDSGSWLSAADLSDKSLHVYGTFGTGGTLIMEGSNNEGVSAVSLNDSRGEGNALSFTAENLVTILENPERIRPRVTAGDGTTSLTVVVVSKSSNK